MAHKPHPQPDPAMLGKDLRIATTPEDLARAIMRGGAPRQPREPAPATEKAKSE